MIKKNFRNIFVVILIVMSLIAICKFLGSNQRNLLTQLKTYHMVNAIKTGNIGKVKFLVYINKKNSQINLDNDIEANPLFLAIHYGRTDIMRVLIKNGADVNQRNRLDTTPLHYAIQSTRYMIYDNPDKSQEEFRSKFIKNDNYEMVKILIENGAEVNSRINSGWFGSGDEITPLFFATEFGLKDIVVLLIANGADPNAINIIDKKEKTALSVARERGYDEIADILKPHTRK